MLTENDLYDLVEVDGNFVERDVLRVVEAIQAYDPDLRVQYFEGVAQLQEAPYRIVRTGQDGRLQVVLTAWNLDDSVLTRLYFSDTRVHDVGKRVEAANAQVKADTKKAHKEEMLEESLRAATVLGSPKDTYSVPSLATGEILTIRSDGTVGRKKTHVSYRGEAK